MKVELKAYAKINLGLDVLRKREDGYHEVKMIMQTVDLYDKLMLEKIDENRIELSTNIESLEADERNLVYRAIKLIKDRYNLENGVIARLEKNIPIAAGMAGGSTDCAAALKGMNKLFDLHISDEELMKLGKTLGADVPYCIMGGTALAEGIGEKLTPLNRITGDYVVIAKPKIGVSTKYVYENLDLSDNAKHPNINRMIGYIEEMDKENLFNCIGNILETVTEKKYNVISEIKEFLKDKGAVNSLMSGSGPTVFAIFNSKKTAQLACDAIQKEYDLDIAKVVTLI